MAAHDDNILCCEFAVEVGEFVDEAVVNVRTGYNNQYTAGANNCGKVITG